MTARARLLAVALVVGGAGACTRPRCRDGTALLSYSLGNGAEAADTIDVTLAIDGGATQTRQVTRRSPMADGSIEVDFDAYPAGKMLAFTLSARAGTTLLAAQTQRVTVDGRCLALSFRLVPGGVTAVADGGADLATTPDLGSRDCVLDRDSYDDGCLYAQ